MTGVVVEEAIEDLQQSIHQAVRFSAALLSLLSLFHVQSLMLSIQHFLVLIQLTRFFIRIIL